MSILRGTLIGFFLGTLPGVGATAATMIAYMAERRQSRTPERFGKGAIEGSRRRKPPTMLPPPAPWFRC